MMKNMVRVSIAMLSLMFLTFTPIKASAYDDYPVYAAVGNFYQEASGGHKNRMKKYIVEGAMFGKGSLSNVYWKYIRKYNKKMEYDIKSVKMTKNTATVKVKVKYIDLSDIHYDSMINQMDWAMAYGLKNNHIPNESLMRRYYARFFSKNLNDALFDYKWGGDYPFYYNTKTGTLKLVRVGTKWRIKSLNHKAYDTVTCGFDEARAWAADYTPSY